MTTFILIDEDGSIKQQKSRVNRETLYKKCGFKKSDEFKLQHTWLVETCNIHSVELWARDVFSRENENKYILPSPLTTRTYYGTIAAIALNEKGDIISMTIEKWKKIYEDLCGYIESEELQSDDDEEIDIDADELDGLISTKEKASYLNDEESNEETNELEDDVPTVRKLPNELELDDEEMLNQLQCGSELEEEEYEYSDTE